MTRLLLVAATGLCLGLAIPASGKQLECTYQGVCEDSHKLNKTETIEFKGRCYESDGRRADADVQTEEQLGLVHRDLQRAGRPPYKSCSCTNWDFTSNHKARVTLNCMNPQ